MANSSESLMVETSRGTKLDCYMSESPHSGKTDVKDAVLLLHGFPSGNMPAALVGGDLPALCDRITKALGNSAVSMKFSGCGKSDGNFSLSEWIEDVISVCGYLKESHGVDEVRLCGFGTGGAIALNAAVVSDMIVSVVALATPADFSDWAAAPKELVNYAREVKVIKDSTYPKDMDRFVEELNNIGAVDAAEKIQHKSLLVMHGSEDEVVPHFDARIIADAHANADLRFVQGVEHAIRQDPRAIAILIGWIERNRRRARNNEDAIDNEDIIDSEASNGGEDAA